jgi:hypothetical protein
MVEPRNPFAPEARKGSLIVACEADQEEVLGRPACQLVATTIQKTFYDDRSLSVTSSLREALRVANRALYQNNFQVVAPRRAHVGGTCMVLKGWDLFVAQVGPTCLFVLAEGRVRAFPERPASLSLARSAPVSSSSALGSSLTIEPELYRSLLQVHDAFLLCSTDVASLLRWEHIEAILHTEDVAEGLEQVYRQCQCQDTGIMDGYAFVGRLEPLSRSAAQHEQRKGEKPFWSIGSSIRTIGAIGQRIRTIWSGEKRMSGATSSSEQEHRPFVFDETSAPGAAAENTKKTTSDPMTTMPDQPDIPRSPFPRPQPLDLRQPGEREQPGRSDPLRQDDWLTKGPGRGATPRPHRPVPVVLSHAPTEAPPYRPRFQRRPFSSMRWSERVLYPFQLLAHSVAAIFTTPSRRGPSSSAIVRLEGEKQQREKPRFQWLIFLVLVLSVISLVLYGMNLSRRSAEQRDMEYLDQASQYLEAMYQAPTRNAALEYLGNAEQALGQVWGSSLVTRTNSTLWMRYQDIQHEYEHGLALVKRQTFLEHPTVLAMHPSPTGRFSSVVVPPATSAISNPHTVEAMEYLYALDTNKRQSAIYRVPRGGGRPSVFLASQQDVRGTIIGTIHAIAWRIDNIVAVDESEETSSFGYYFRNNGTWNYTRLGGSDIWVLRGRLDMEEYQGNLYFWGAEAGEIVKFSSGHYGDIPQLWLSMNDVAGIDITTAIDMAIDGNIYLLVPGGQVLVFRAGQYERTITPEPITPPLTSATRFCVTGGTEGGYMYLLDTLNERIVQIDKNSGSVIQQMTVHPDTGLRLNQLTDLAVDTSRNRPLLYLVNGREIIRGSISVPPPPFEPGGATPPSRE